MLRKLIQSALCICLCPLLAAQEVAPQNAQTIPSQINQSATTTTTTPTPPPQFVTIPKDTEIDLVALESVSSATAKVGDAVRFAVAKDLVVNEVVVLRTGTQIMGKVTKVERGISGKRDGFLRIRIDEGVILGDGRRLLLTDSDPEYRQSKKNAAHEKATDALFSVGSVVLCAITLPLCIAWIAQGGDEGRSKSKPAGLNAILPVCWSIQRWTLNETNDSVESLNANADVRPEKLGSTCIYSGAAPAIDWSVSDYEMLEVD